MIDFEIRPLHTIEEFHAAEDLQRVAWNSDDLDITPTHVLLTAAKNGGVVLGAFAHEQLIGFVFGFLGAGEHRFGPEAPVAMRLKHCSHQMGVLPEWQSKNVGYALKLAQREAILNQSLRLITWTFDPLESKNARLNILKLGAVTNTYLRNVYGDLRDGLNQGLATDRFQVDWWIASRRVETRLKQNRPALQLQHYTQAGTSILNQAKFDENGLLVCMDAVKPLSDDRALLEIPSDFQSIKKTKSDLARAWREQIRSICEGAFARGYSVIDFVYESGPPARSFYVLQQVESSESALNA
jgi:predicted GNAT superfamily acetyltransferase